MNYSFFLNPTNFRMNRNVMYALPVVGLFAVLAFYQVIKLTEPYTLYSTDGYRSLSSKIVPTHREISSHCLLSTPRFQGIKVYSQNDEDGIILHLLRCMGGHGKKEYFEFGAHDGMQVNTRVLRDHYGWKGHMLDGAFDKPEIGLHKEWFTPSNIAQLLEKYEVSKTVDVLSVDADCDDFWITREILASGYKPRVLIQEYNPQFDSQTAISTLPKEIGKESEGHCIFMYYGASALAFQRMLYGFGYTLVHSNKVNLFFVRSDLASGLGLNLPAAYDVVQPVEKKDRPPMDMGLPDPLTKDRGYAVIDDKAVDILTNPAHAHATVKKLFEDSSVKMKHTEQAYYRFNDIIHD